MPLAGFLGLSAALFLSLPSRHFQTGNARGVRPSGVCSFHEDPAARRRPASPLEVRPAGCTPPSLDPGDTAGAPIISLGVDDAAPLRLYRVSIRVEIGRQSFVIFRALGLTLPLLGFRLLMVTPRAQAGYPAAVTGFTEEGSVARPRPSCLSRRCYARELPLSHERDVPSRGSSPSTAPPFRDHPARDLAYALRHGSLARPPRAASGAFWRGCPAECRGYVLVCAVAA